MNRVNHRGSVEPATPGLGGAPGLSALWTAGLQFASMWFTMAANDDGVDKPSGTSESQRAGSDPGADDLTRLSDDESATAPPEVDATLVYEPPAEGETPSRRSRLQPGSILFGEYEIEEVLGSGGMGDVYKAKHRALSEYRAIKVLHADISEKKVTAALFLREAKALLAVRHPAVVHCHDLLSDESGRVFLIMELIEGRSLADRLTEGPLTTDEVVMLGGRLSAGLRAAHEKGVVHRDVSPDNIVLEGGDVSQAKLIDFGIAKILEEGQGTVVDGFKGKLSYASPEQLGFFGGRIDGRSDLYSLGLVLCAASLGRPLGMGKTVVEAVDARRGLVQVPDEIPIGLRSALEPLLVLDPSGRPEMAERLFLAPGMSPGSAPVKRDRSRSFNASNPLIVASVVFVAVSLLAYGFWPGPTGDSVDPAIVPPSAVLEEVDSEVKASVRDAAPKNSAALAGEEPSVRAPSALDELRIMGLLRGAQDALAEDRLRRPAGNNAYEKYTAVLALDPSNTAAQRGLASVGGRYLVLSERALEAGELEKASRYLDDAIAVSPGHPRIAVVEAALQQARQ